MWFRKTSARRQAIREDMAEAGSARKWWAGGSGYIGLVAGVFFLVACAVQFWPDEPLPYRQGELAPMDLTAPVGFRMVDPGKTEQARAAARVNTPPLLVRDNDIFGQIHNQLTNLKTDAMGARSVAQLPLELQQRFPGLNDAALQAIQRTDNESYERSVNLFLEAWIRYTPLVSPADHEALGKKRLSEVYLTREKTIERTDPISRSWVFTVDGAVEPAARERIHEAVMSVFASALWDPITNYIMNLSKPTYRYDPKLSLALEDQAAGQTLPEGEPVVMGEVIVKRGELITREIYQKLCEAEVALEQRVARDHPWATWLSRLGRALIVLILTAAGTVYIGRLTHIKVNLERAWAVCGLLLAGLIVAKVVVSALPQTTYCMGILPTMLTAIILVIAYNQRFALGVAAIHGLLVTLTLGLNIDFFLTMLAGITVFSIGLSEIRTRGKLIEVGVVASAVTFATVWAIGLARMAGSSWMPWVGGGGIMDTHWVATQSVWAAFAGAGVAMVALFILPPVERVFKITTAMTLLELCDANKPLLQRLSQEAPGTFNHSLTVGIMAEAAGNAIGANGLLCRVGAYYHDVGKLSKPQYFIENQAAGRPNRHDKLSPAMSLLIIVGHVKDGIELAREYGLPWVIHQFIAQHHGTTLVEYFFHAARKRAEQQGAGGGDLHSVSDSEFRYPGPKPQTREAAIVMICDGCESVVRSIEEPTPGRIETAAHNLITKRLMDGQFSECDLTLRDLSVIEETLVRTLGGVHHGRIAYPGKTEEDAGSSDVGISQPA